MICLCIICSLKTKSNVLRGLKSGLQRDVLLVCWSGQLTHASQTNHFASGSQEDQARWISGPPDCPGYSGSPTSFNVCMPFISIQFSLDLLPDLLTQHREQGQAPQSGFPPPDSLAFGWALNLKRTCLKAIQAILNNRTKDSTRKCYLVK